MIAKMPSTTAFCPPPAPLDPPGLPVAEGRAAAAQDAEMMEQIDRDVLRTHPGLHFFSGDDGAAVTHREVCLAAGPRRPCVEQTGLG